MADPIKTPAEGTPHSVVSYGRADSVLFQAWLILFLVVICLALVNYLVSYMPK